MENLTGEIPFLDDCDRPLNNGGHLDAKKIGTFLANNGLLKKLFHLLQKELSILHT